MGLGDLINEASDLIVQAGVVSAFFVYYLFKGRSDLADEKPLRIECGTSTNSGSAAANDSSTPTTKESAPAAASQLSSFNEAFSKAKETSLFSQPPPFWSSYKASTSPPPPSSSLSTSPPLSSTFSQPTSFSSQNFPPLSQPLSETFSSQPPLSQPPLSQPPLSQPSLSQPPLSEPRTESSPFAATLSHSREPKYPSGLFGTSEVVSAANGASAAPASTFFSTTTAASAQADSQPQHSSAASSFEPRPYTSSELSAPVPLSGETKAEEAPIAAGLVGERSKLIAAMTEAAQPGRATLEKREAEEVARPLDPSLLRVAESVVQLRPPPRDQRRARSAASLAREDIPDSQAPQRFVDPYEEVDDASIPDVRGRVRQWPPPSNAPGVEIIKDVWQPGESLLAPEVRPSTGSREPSLQPPPVQPRQHSLQPPPAHLAQAQRNVSAALSLAAQYHSAEEDLPKAVRNPAAPVTDYDRALNEFGDVVTNMMGPAESQAISASLSQAQSGRGAALFNKRRENSQAWVVRPSSVQRDAESSARWGSGGGGQGVRDADVVESVVSAASRKLSPRASPLPSPRPTPSPLPLLSAAPPQPQPRLSRHLHHQSSPSPLPALSGPPLSGNSSHSSRYEQHVRHSKEELNQSGDLYQVEEPIRRAESAYHSSGRSSSVIRQPSRTPAFSPAPQLRISTGTFSPQPMPPPRHRQPSPGGSPLPQPFPASHNPRPSVERLFSPTPFAAGGSQRLFSPVASTASRGTFSPSQSLRRRTPSPSQPQQSAPVSAPPPISQPQAPPASTAQAMAESARSMSTFNALPKSWSSFSESYRSNS